MSNAHESFEDRVWGATFGLDTTDSADAAWAADEIIDLFVEFLRRDSSISKRTYDDWVIALGDLRNKIEELLAIEICDDRVNLQDTVEAILDEIGDED
jgi:hypothetical protein